LTLPRRKETIHKIWLGREIRGDSIEPGFSGVLPNKFPIVPSVMRRERFTPECPIRSFSYLQFELYRHRLWATAPANA